MNNTKILLASSFLVLVSACSGSCSCGTNDDDDGSGGGSTGVTGSGGSDSGTGGEGTGGNPGAGGDTGAGGNPGAGGGGDVAGYCALGCEEAADCCPEGVPDCPSETYPNNWTCDEGLCANAGCLTNDDCTFGGALPTYECFPSPAGGICYEACEVDDDCTTPDFTCSGELDGRTHCAGEPVEPVLCEDDDDCGGFGTCQEDGSCSCASNDECTAEGYVCVE